MPRDFGQSVAARVDSARGGTGGARLTRSCRGSRDERLDGRARERARRAAAPAAARGFACLKSRGMRAAEPGGWGDCDRLGAAVWTQLADARASVPRRNRYAIRTVAAESEAARIGAP